MSTEQKPDHEQETLKNTSDPWSKNAEDHHRLELQIALLAGRLGSVYERLGSVSERLASVEGKLDKLSEESAKRDEKTRADFKEAMKEMKAEFKEEMEKIEERAERRRKEDQARSRWFAGFLILLATATIGVVSHFSAIASFFTTLP